jgi:serine/threonine protein phosphatase PrpC
MQRIILDNVGNLDAACSELVKEANERGGEDNITLVIARLTGSDLPEPTDEDIRIEPIDLGDIHDTDDQDTAEIL